MVTNVFEQRINKIQSLLDRLDRIPRELDDIHRQLFGRPISSKRFTELVTMRNNLLKEQESKERALKDVYRIMELEDEYIDNDF